MDEQKKNIPKSLMILFILLGILCIGAISFSAFTLNESGYFESGDEEEVIEDSEDSEDSEESEGEDESGDEDSEESESTVSTYTNEELGISFDYPSTYRVSESEEMERFDEGEKLTVNVFDEYNNLVFQAQATSTDYTEGITEGCCWFYSGTLNTGWSIGEIKNQIERQLREIFDPYRSEIGGNEAIGFFYARDYAMTNVVAAHIMPIDHDVYSNVFFTSGWLWSNDGHYAMNIAKIRNIFSQGHALDALDLEMEEEYLEILQSINWN